MIIIPGFLISLLTFPGVMVHEFAHQLFCRIMRVPVYDVVYFQAKNPLTLLLGWLGVSILMHAFPSTGDAKVMVKAILKNQDVNPVVMLV